MSYRDEREKQLKSIEKGEMEDYEFDQYLDYFFEKLLNIRRAICLNDYSILQDCYFNSDNALDILCTPEEKAYFHRKPITLVGAQEYYNLYVEKIKPYYKTIHETIEEALEEDGRGFPSNRKKQIIPDVSVSITQTIETPSDESPVFMSESEKKITDTVLNGNYNDVVSAPINEKSKEYTEGRRHIPKLFRYYLKCLIEHTINNLSKAEKTELKKDIPTVLKNDEEKETKGRKRIDIKEVLFYFIDQVNENDSNNVYEGKMPFIKKEGYCKSSPRINSMTKYRELNSTSMLLKRMIEHSARPFNRYEHIFAVDGTGLNCVTKNAYCRDKHHQKIEHDWCDLHAICGVKSNIITSAVVTHKYKTDETDEVLPLIERTLLNFKISYVVGDRGYLDEESMQEARSRYNVKILCPIKTNTIINPEGKGEAWNENIDANLSEEWDKIYHVRSNVESSFSALKKSVGEILNHSKKEKSRINEAYCKVVVYNILRLIVYRSTSKIMPDWKELNHEIVNRLLNDEVYSEILKK